MTDRHIVRNPHPDFKTVEGSRDRWDKSADFHLTQVPNPDWTPRSGANDESWKQHKTVGIDPYEPGRAAVDNYKRNTPHVRCVLMTVLISGIVPRPIGFVSSIAADGQQNLAPFSYTQVFNHDPPVFCIGFAGGKSSMKDTCANILATKECVINIISDSFLEAANYTSINAPPEVNEWDLSGLTKAPSTMVAPARVAESAFAVECKLMDVKEFTSPQSGKMTAIMVILQGHYFHVREDAINEARNLIDPSILRPMSRLGGITYGRVTQGVEIPRPDYETEKKEKRI